MRFENPGQCSLPSPAAVLTAVALLKCACAWANPQPDASAGSDGQPGSVRQPAVWAPRELNFVYREFTTRYSCDGLQDRMKQVLIRLGAHDVQVRGYGCTRLRGPDQFAGVSIRMKVLQPAGRQDGAAIPAHWQKVDLLADVDDRDPAGAAADCELTAQIRQQILPLFRSRNVDYRASCEPHGLLLGATWLKAEVLLADKGSATDSAAR
jgi:hypothetical protein